VGFTQPLAEMSTRSRKIMFMASKMRSVRRADNLTAICEPIQVQVILRPTVSLGVRTTSVAHDQIFITVGHLQSSCCGVPSLTRGRVCTLLIQFAVTLRSNSRRTHDHILLSHLRLHQPWSWTWSSSCGRQSVDQCRLGIGPPFGTLDQILSCSSYFV
jgi:hypothetical protein